MRLYNNDEYREEFMERVYSLLSSDGTNDRANQIIDAFDAAPAVEVDSSLLNAPLTIDELWRMDGLPVWIVGVSCINNFNGHWDICEWEENGDVVSFPYCMESPDIELLNIEWFAYRRKPEEAT